MHTRALRAHGVKIVNTQLRRVRHLLIAALLVSITTEAFAQKPTEGRIIGTVIDSETGEPIIGANVLLEGTTKGAATDIGGRYSLSVQPGTYTLVVSVISYRKQRITNVEIAPNQSVRIDVVLAPDVIALEEVQVEARALLSYEGALLTRRRKASSIGDGISAELIRRTPDATSGDALRRITGVSILENKYISVRGTPERYSSAMLNGSAVSSTEPDRKAFTFDLIPSNLIDNAVVTKSFTPDLPGDFAGGLVKMNTIDFPSQLTLRLSYSASHNTNSTFKPFKTYDGGKSDFLGIDDGSRRLPASFPRSLGDKPYTSGELNEFARSLANTWAPVERKAPPGNNFLISLGDGTTLLGNKFGFVTALTYRSSFDYSTLVRNEYEASGEPRFQYSGDQSTFSVSWGGLANLSYRISEFHRFSIRNTFSRTADDEVTQFSGIQYTDIGAEQRHTALRFVSRSVLSTQLLGEHFFSAVGGLQAEWKVSRSRSTRDEPDYRRVVYFRESGSDDPFSASLGFQANLKNGGRFYSDLVDDAASYSIDLSAPFLIGKLKAGYLFEQKTRSFTSRLIGIVTNARGNGFTEPELYLLPIDQIFDPANFRPNGFSIDEYQNGTNNYDAANRIHGAYLMLDVPLSLFRPSDLRLIGGLRYERSRQSVGSMDLSGRYPIAIELANANFLPAVNAVYSLNENTNLRAAYSRTINRPELRELAPFAYFDFNTQTSVRGNEGLKQSQIQNFDLRLETFPAAGEILSVSLFYKSLRDAIEQVVVTGSALGSERTFANAERASNFGLELEARISLRFLTEELSDFSIRGNYSRIHSVVHVAGSEWTVERRNRPLQGQSPYTVNLALSYENAKWGTSMNALFNRFGARIVEVATLYEEDVIEQPRSTLDIVVTQDIFPALELKFTAKDVLREEQVFCQGDKVARSNHRGRTFAVGLSFKI